MDVRDVLSRLLLFFPLRRNIKLHVLLQDPALVQQTLVDDDGILARFPPIRASERLTKCHLVFGATRRARVHR